MRNYAKASPTFWTGKTGSQIRAAGRDAQVVAFYLYTCPNSNWIGLYYLPLPTLCHEVGISEHGALRALDRLAEIDFARYDRKESLIWIPEMAKWQIGREQLKPGDKRVKGIEADLNPYLLSGFAREFYDRYREVYRLPETLFKEGPSEGPSKPLRSTETESESETATASESASESERGAAKGPRSKRRPSAVATPAPENLEITDALKEWANRHVPGDLGIDLNGEAENFLTNARARGRMLVDWHYGYRNWLLKAVEFKTAGRHGAFGGGNGSHGGNGNGSNGNRGGSGPAGDRKPFEGAPSYRVGSK
jgi:hypothetical protein